MGSVGFDILAREKKVLRNLGTALEAKAKVGWRDERGGICVILKGHLIIIQHRRIITNSSLKF